MSCYTRKEIEELHGDISALAAKAIGAENSSDQRQVVDIIEYCLGKGYERRKMSEKLEKLLDAKYSSRLLDKLQDKLDDYKRKMRKRAVAGGNEEEATPKKSRFDSKEKNGVENSKQSLLEEPAAVPASAVPTAPTSIMSATATNSALSSNQIKLMMANAQREIEERKRALSSLKAKDPLLAAVPQIALPVALASQMLAKKPTPEDAEKAKKIAELQAQIRAKLSGTLANFLPPVAAEQDRPKPLILDEEGRTIDKSGRAVNIPILTPTLKANIRAKKREVFNKTQTNERHTATQDDQVKFFDERIAQKPLIRNKRALRFHEPGKFQQMAERLRMKSQLERLQNEISQIARKTGISSATKLALIAPKQDMPDDVPSMEWWDSVILTNDLNTKDESGKIKIRESAISNLIEHPTQMKPPSKLNMKLLFWNSQNFLKCN